MSDHPLPVRRLSVRLTGDSSRTILRCFWPGNVDRVARIADRVLGMPQERAAAALARTRSEFRGEHPDLEYAFRTHMEDAEERLGRTIDASEEQRLLIGAYLTMEYAFESAALFNPSMVARRDQSGLPPGHLRVMISLRAVGEGHISSIVFRRARLTENCDVIFEKAGAHSMAMRPVENAEYEREVFRQKLREMDGEEAVADAILDSLDEHFSANQLRAAIADALEDGSIGRDLNRAAERLIWMLESNYQLRYPPDVDMSEVVIFPVSPTESNGIEDMRLVRFVEDDGEPIYYGTYTAYNGRDILPQLFESPEPDLVRVNSLCGRFAHNKGLALFPRRVGGKYVMSARCDGENLFILQSENIRVWDEGVKVQEPRYPWEFVQLGNCGSPIETEVGWLLLTHGVGPMRRYCIGASLLDLDDPTRLIGRTPEPILAPIEDEADGYVPNVTYSCGALIHNGHLVIPYGISDSSTGFAVTPLDEVLARMEA